MEKSGMSIVRSGEFSLSTYGDNHCGTSDHFKVKYHLSCDCSSKLDRRGFLFDQLNIQAFFESIENTHLSCERLTVACAQQLLRHILTENSGCEIYKMQLTLAPEPFLASMTHTLETNDGAALTMPPSPKTSSKSTSRVHDPSHKHTHSHNHYTFQEEEN